MDRATRASWQTKPMPAARARVDWTRRFTPDEHERLSRGLVPREMEDKWFAFVEDEWLHLHRSWTGVCIYEARLERDAEGWRVAEAWANRDPAEYRVTDDAYDARMLWFLVERLLLGRDVPFPEVGASSLLQHHVVGHGRPNDD